jgi:hypothetical protein
MAGVDLSSVPAVSLGPARVEQGRVDSLGSDSLLGAAAPGGRAKQAQGGGGADDGVVRPAR